ncbi:type II toxin-antitoxin system VapC family toxin [Microbacterium sp.]|uniref:type II toxin-antitoxin system VapC family toxin n=1 Tax=Microbacterium sp. TaxID=51671 RepID=UPI003C788C25
MIVDSSALISALLLEPGSERIFELLGEYGGQIPAPILVEARMVARSKAGSGGVRRLEGIIRQFRLGVTPFDLEQADVASSAHISYGRGTGHPARLNLGDTYSYALAYVRDEPLLFVGDDFGRTDIRSALEEYGEEYGEAYGDDHAR